MRDLKSEEMLSKVSTMTVRLTPRLRYLAELGARECELNLTRYLEQCVKQALTNGDSPHLTNEGLWDEDPAKRLFLLVTARPDLMDANDQLLWRRIIKTPELISANGVVDCAKVSAQWIELTAATEEQL